MKENTPGSEYEGVRQRLSLMVLVALQDLWANKAMASVMVLSMACGMSILAGLLSVIQGQRKNMELLLTEMGGSRIVRAVLYNRTFKSKTGVDWDWVLKWSDQGISNDEGAMVQLLPSGNAYSAAGQVLSNNAFPAVDVRGVTHTYRDFGAIRIQEGRFLSAWDGISRNRVCVVGDGVAKSLGDQALGSTLILSEQGFEVVGILSPKAEVKHAYEGSISAWKDQLVLIPFPVALESFPGHFQALEIYMKTDRNGNPLKPIPLPKGTDAALETNAWVVQMYANVVKRMMPGVWALIGLSTLMACIGVVNIMVSGISERIQEIGVRRSVGASSSDILLQFVAEAGICGILGSGIGWILGDVTSRAVAHVAALPRAFSWWALILCFLAGPVSGMLAGLYPALKARKIDPVEALREE